MQHQGGPPMFYAVPQAQPAGQQAVPYYNPRPAVMMPRLLGSNTDMTRNMNSASMVHNQSQMKPLVMMNQQMMPQQASPIPSMNAPTSSQHRKRNIKICDADTSKDITYEMMALGITTMVGATPSGSSLGSFSATPPKATTSSQHQKRNIKICDADTGCDITYETIALGITTMAGGCGATPSGSSSGFYSATAASPEAPTSCQHRKRNIKICDANTGHDITYETIALGITTMAGGCAMTPSGLPSGSSSAAVTPPEGDVVRSSQSAVDFKEILMEAKSTQTVTAPELSSYVTDKNESNKPSASAIISLSDIESEESEHEDRKSLVMVASSAHPKLKYKEDQWSPVNTEGKRQYDRVFLMLLRFEALSLQKPEGLPNIDIIKDKPVTSSPENSFDFTPGFVQSTRKRNSNEHTRRREDFNPKTIDEPHKEAAKESKVKEKRRRNGTVQQRLADTRKIRQISSERLEENNVQFGLEELRPKMWFDYNSSGTDENGGGQEGLDELGWWEWQ